MSGESKRRNLTLIVFGVAAAAGVGIPLYLNRGEPQKPVEKQAPPPVAVEQPTAPTPAKPIEAPAQKKPAPMLVQAPAGPAKLTPGQLAEKIDAYFSAYWKKTGVAPAGPATDEEFVRRAHLDLNGRIPTAEEVRSFAADRGADKRGLLTDELVGRARFAVHMANVFRDLLLPGAATDPRAQALAAGFEAWLRLRWSANVPTDALLSELLAANSDPNAMRNEFVGGRNAGPQAFVLIHDGKPEELASSAARVFLGVQIGCAQCHDHPFDTWKQEQFWSFAAFFAPEPADTGRDFLMRSALARKELVIPGKNSKVQPRFLDGEVPSPGAESALQHALVEWLTNPSNPYFAVAAANRYWALLFGRGLVNPADDLKLANLGPHAELLKLLAEQFRANGHDAQHIVKSIARSKAYALAGVGGNKAAEDAAAFGRMPLKTMSADQIYDSLERAAGGFSAPAPVRNAPIPVPVESEKVRFRALFSDPGDRTVSKASVVQSLVKMNGASAAEACDPARGRFLRALAASPFLDDKGRIETLFLSTLSRRPTTAEFAAMTALLADAKDAAGKTAALGDCLWAVINAGEFALVP